MISSRSRRAGSSVSASAGRAAKNLPKPHKRPVQDRSRFTMQAIYDAYVRIWRRDGPSAATTRSVAAEAGFAIGTFYDYFPNRAALHSGYVRYTIDWLLAAIDAQIADGANHRWRDNLDRLVSLTCGEGADQPYFDVDMLDRVADIAENHHHQRVFEELASKWTEAMASWADLEPKPSPATVDALILLLWGARRYRLLLDLPGGRLDGWICHTRAACRLLLEPPSIRA